jgi:hypothetical protein
VVYNGRCRVLGAARLKMMLERVLCIFKIGWLVEVEVGEARLDVLIWFSSEGGNIAKIWVWTEK